MDDELSPEDLESLSEAMNIDDDGDANENTTDDNDSLEDGIVADADDDDEENDSSSDDASISHAQFMQLEENSPEEDSPLQPIERMYDIKVNVEVVLGTTKMTLDKILRLKGGNVVPLNKLAGEPVDILANGRHIARAEVVVIEENYGIKIIDIVGSRQKFAALQGR